MSTRIDQSIRPPAQRLIRHSGSLSFRFLEGPGLKTNFQKRPFPEFPLLQWHLLQDLKELLSHCHHSSDKLLQLPDVYRIFSFERKYSYKKRHRHPNCTASFLLPPENTGIFLLLPEGKLSHLHREGSLVNEPSQELILPSLPP